MPIYEYRCTACNHQFELRQKFSDALADQCPKCGGAVHKMVSASAFSLKGGGWYGDNYDAKAEAPKTESDSAIGTGTAADSAPTDSAPTDSTTKETTAAPATSSAKSQSETKSSVAEKPAATEKPKSEK
jgi:putative FmdB family regulatory protein